MIYRVIIRESFGILQSFGTFLYRKSQCCRSDDESNFSIWVISPITIIVWVMLKNTTRMHQPALGNQLPQWFRVLPCRMRSDKINLHMRQSPAVAVLRGNAPLSVA